MDTIGSMFNDMFRGLRDRFASEIETIRQQFPAEPFTFLDPPLKLNYAEGVAMLREVRCHLPNLFLNKNAKT